MKTKFNRLKGRLALISVAASVLLTASIAEAQKPGSLGSWQSTQSLPYRVENPAAVAFGGRIYVLGGHATPLGAQAYLDNLAHFGEINSDGTLRSWQTTTPFANGRDLHAAALDPATRTIFIIGGRTSTSTLRGITDVQYARIISGGVGVWTPTSPLPTGLSGHSAVVYNGYLYVFGGLDQSDIPTNVYYFAPINSDGSLGAWNKGFFVFDQDTHSFGVGGPRRYHTSFAHNGHLYVLGGQHAWDNLPLGDIQVAQISMRRSGRFDFLKPAETENWKAISALPSPRYFHGTASENRFVYVVGGVSPPSGDLNDVQYAEILNDGTLGPWKTTTSLPSARRTHACVAHGGRLYVIGGRTDTVLYAPIQSASDTTPPKTQVSPPPGPQPSSSVNVTVTATDVGGSGIGTVRYTKDGSDPVTSPTAIAVTSPQFNVAGTTPMTLKASALDSAGNLEPPITAIFTNPQRPDPNLVKFQWPVSGTVTQDFYDDYSGVGAGVFYDDSDQAQARMYKEANAYFSKSLTHDSSEPNVDPNNDGVYEKHLHVKLHRGIDIASTGPVRPALRGVATRFDWNRTAADFYGNRVLIDHGQGYHTLYAHLDDFSGKLASVGNGQSVPVESSDVIGQVGKTGGTQGVHMHFEVRHSADARSYAQGAHYVPVPASRSVIAGEMIPHDYPGLGGTILPVQIVNSGGLFSIAGTTPAVSDNGSWIGFRNSPLWHLVNLANGSTYEENADGDRTLGNGGLFSGAFSADSSVKAFASDDLNLVSGDANAVSDVFVWNRETGTTERVSVSSAGSEANGASYDVTISADGRYVAFTSLASNLVADDSNGAADVFVRDHETRTTTRVSVGSGGAQANGASYSPSISADGRYLAFVAESSNLVTGDANSVADIFVRDLESGTTKRINTSSSGSEANGPSRQPSISGDGRYIAFESDAKNLVAGDNNGFADVFLRDTATGSVQRISVGPNGEEGNDASHEPRISTYGLVIAFISKASNLVSGDTNGKPDVFVAKPAISGSASPPTITSQPRSQTVTAGTTVTFSVSATGTAPLTYQWKRNGVDLPGETRSSLSPSNVGAKDEGSYTVTVSNAAGSATSNAAILTVNIPPSEAEGLQFIKQWEGVYQAADGRLAEVIQTRDGGFALTGSEGGFVLVKTDQAGVEQWRRSVGNGTSAALIQSDGGYVLGGSSPDPKSTSGKFDFKVFKLDATGKPEWERTFDKEGGDERLNSVIQTRDGGHILGGHRQIAGSEDVNWWVIKITSGGDKEWERDYGGAGNEQFSSLKETADGGFILVGTSNSSTNANKKVPSFGGYDRYVVKINRLGDIEWERSFGGTEDEDIGARSTVVQTRDGYLIAGFSRSGVSGNKTKPNLGGADGWVLKLDANGSVLWEEVYGGTSDDGFGSIEQATDGGFVLSGTSRSGVSGTKNSPNYGGNDYWVMKIDANGKKQGEAVFGGAGTDDGGLLKQTSEEAFVLGGYSDSDVSGNKERSLSGRHYWIIELLIREAVQAPSIIAHPQSQTVNTGALVTFAVTATGTAQLSYQWKKNGANLPGQTNLTLTLPSVSATDAGDYAVTVTNAAGSDTSSIARLTVNTPPVITGEPQSQTVPTGGNVTFSVEATRTAPLSYQWLFQGAPLAGATEAKLSLSNVQSANAGSYSVKVSNSAGTVTSASASLTVTPPPPRGLPTISPIANQVTRKNTDTEPIPFTVSDPETPAASLEVTFGSDNPVLVPSQTNIQSPLAGAERLMIIRPAAGQSGVAKITVIVKDSDNNRASTTFELTVLGDPPKITAIANQTIRRGGTTAAIAFTISDAETLPRFLKLSYDSSNQAVVPNSSIELGGNLNSTNRTVTVTPVADQIGMTTITITVTDNEGQTVKASFLLTVAPDQRPPNRPVNVWPASGATNVPLLVTLQASTFSDPDAGDSHAATQWIIQRISDGVEWFNSGEDTANLTNRFVFPALDYSTAYTWTVKFKDNYGKWSEYSVPTTFTTQAPSNTPPWISEIGEQRTARNETLRGVAFSVADTETALDALNITAHSENQILVPDSNISVEGKGRDRTLTITPAPNQSGATRITVTVKDEGGLTATGTFDFTVTGGADKPPTPTGRPTNDDFSKRIRLFGALVSTDGSNVEATKEPGEPNHANKAGGKSVWWSWTALQDGNVTVSTAGSSIDTLLAVYTGSAAAGLNLIKANDDDEVNGGTTSLLTFRAQAGTEYQIAVDALGGAGSIKLSILSEAARPALKVEVSGRNIALSWPASATGFIIEVSDSLFGPNWTPVPLAPIVLSDVNSVKVPISSGTKFYRLRRQ